MNKQPLIRKIVTALNAELETYTRSARAAHAEATDEQSKAENKYDTRGLEASYLARGQSRQAAEVIQSIQNYESLRPRSFGKEDPIDIGAVVRIDSGSELTFYFIGPSSGGTEIEHEGNSILVVTPQSPLGQQLIGKKCGDHVNLPASPPQSVGVVRSVQ
jgi:transcription elongation GreA/GreB family factor